MVDAILKVLALLTFVAALAIVAIKIPAPELVVVIVLVAGLAIYDFFIHRNRGSEPNDKIGP